MPTSSSTRQNASFELRDPVTPYVCSTPNDFSEEREFIRNHVFPRLDEMCRSRGSYFSPVDFTWREGDGKMDSGILLKTQLDAVKKCSPFFMGILGETYGPHRDPDAPRLKKTVVGKYGRGLLPEGNNTNGNSLDQNFLMAAHVGHSWVLEDAHQTSSITELEVTQANFLCDNQHSTLYYRQLEHLDDKLDRLMDSSSSPTNYVVASVSAPAVSGLHEDLNDDAGGGGGNNDHKDNNDNKRRNFDEIINNDDDVDDEMRQAIIRRYSSESEYAKTKVRDLKQRLVNRGIPVKYFRTLEELGRHVLEDWREIIDMVLPPLIHDDALLNTMDYHDWISQHSLTTSRTRVFVSTNEVEELLQELSDFALTCTKADAISGSAEHNVFPPATPLRDAHTSSMTAFLKARSPAPSHHASPSILMLGGDRGVGKSAIIARWLQDFRSQYPHVFVKANFVSASSSSANLCSFMHSCIHDLRKQFILSDTYESHRLCMEMEREAMSSVDTFSALCQAFVAALSLGPCVIVIDGLNELTSCLGLSVQEVKEFSWLPDEIPSCCKMIVTTTKSDVSHRSLSDRRDVATVSCPASLMESLTNVALLREYAPNADKLLGGEQKVRHLGSLRVMQSTLGSRVISNEILRPPVYQNLSSFMDQWADIWSLRNFWIKSVQNWVQSHSWLADTSTSEVQFFDNGFDYSGWVADSLCLIALSRNGLTERQVLSILKTIGYEGDLEVRAYEWHQFMGSAGATLHTNADGRIVYSHSYLHEVAEYLFFKSMSSVTHDPAAIQKSCQEEGVRQAYHTHLARFFSQQPLSVQSMGELPWHLMLCGDMLGLIDVLTDSGVLLKMLDGPDRETWLDDLKLYWSVCGLNGYKADHSYLSMMQALGVVDAQLLMQQLEAETDGTNTAWSPSPRIVISTPQPMDDAWEDAGRRDGRLEDRNDDEEGKEEEDEEEEEEEEGQSSKGFDVDDIGSQEKVSLQDDDVDDGNLDESFTEGIFVTQSGQTHSASMSLKTSSRLGTSAHGQGHFPTMTILGWRVAQLLRTLGHAKAYRCMLTSLVKYMQQNYPLSLSQHLLMSQCHYQLGQAQEGDTMMSGGQGDSMAEIEYRLALQSAMTADDMDDDMEHQTAILYLKSTLLCRYGSIVLTKGDLFEAEELLKESLECIEDNNDCYVLRSNIHHHLGQLRALQHDFPRAEACLRQSAQLRSLWVGSSHPLVADVFVELARILISNENTKSLDAGQAESLFREALRIREVTVGPNHISVATVLFELGTLLATEQGQLVKMEAQKLLRRSLDIRTTELGTNHPQTAAVQQSLTHLDVAMKLGHYEFGPAKPKEGRSRNAPFSAMTFRDSDLSRLKNRITTQQQSSGGGVGSSSSLAFHHHHHQDPMNVRSVGREEVMRHNRPDSIGSMASERLLMMSGPPVVVGGGELPRSRLLSRDRNRHGFDSGRSSYTNGHHYNNNKENNNININNNNNNNMAQDLVVLDSLDSKGRRSKIEEHNNNKKGIDVDLNLDIHGIHEGRLVVGEEGQEKDDASNNNNHTDVIDDVMDDVYIDSYADYTNMPPRVQQLQDKKRQVQAQVRPSSAPRKMFQRFQNMEISRPTSTKAALQTHPQPTMMPATNTNSNNNYNNTNNNNNYNNTNNNNNYNNTNNNNNNNPLPISQTQTPTSAGRKSVTSTSCHHRSSGSRRNLWSGRSNASASSVATTSGGHLSRCSVPDRYDISHSTARTISGPHSSLQALLGDAPCPRPPSNNVHHRSAWYHVPGRYSTPEIRYPRKRNQKTENAKDIDAFLALKTHWEKKKLMQNQMAAQREYFKKLEDDRRLLNKKEAEQFINHRDGGDDYDDDDDDDGGLALYQQFYVDKMSDTGRRHGYNTNSNNNSSNKEGKGPHRGRNNRSNTASSSSKKTGSGSRGHNTGGKWYVGKEATPRLMISGLDKVPEPRYNFAEQQVLTRPSQGHGVKFKEPIVVG